MKNLIGKLMVFTLLLFGVAAEASAQGGAGFDLKAKAVVVTDLNRWVGYSSTTVAAGAATITIENPWGPVAIDGWANGINPYIASNTLLIQTEDQSVDEVVTISSASCTSPTSCTVTATFGNAHSGRYTIRSGSYGVNEAIKFVLALGGGQVIIPTGFGGSTSNITGAVGSTSVQIHDMRAGTDIQYGWSGSAYVAIFSISNTGTSLVAPSLASPLLAGAVSPAATVTAMTGTAPAILTLSNDSTPNFNQGNIAIGANTTGATTACLKTRATTTAGPATTTIVTGDDLCELSAYGADGTNYVKSAAIVFDSTGTVASTRVPSVIKFQTGTDAAPTVVTTALTLGADQSAIFVGATSVLSSSGLTLGVAGSVVGAAKFLNATSGTVTMTAPTGALGTVTVLTPKQAGAIPTAYFCGATSGDTTCANAATNGTARVFGGIATLASNAAIISGISPAFTSTATFTCVANDLTTRANPVQVANTSSSSITITNTTGASDVINYICVGY